MKDKKIHSCLSFDPDGNPEIISNSSIYIFLLTFFEQFEDLKATYMKIHFPNLTRQISLYLKALNSSECACLTDTDTLLNHKEIFCAIMNTNDKPKK